MLLVHRANDQACLLPALSDPDNFTTCSSKERALFCRNIDLSRRMCSCSNNLLQVIDAAVG